MGSLRLRLRPLVILLAALATLAFVASEADARAGSSRSSGSRGTNTFSAPPATRTAPNAAAPMERSMTQPGQPGAFGRQATPARQPGGMFGGLFNRPGLLGGLAAGFLGAGLLGLLFGHGLLGGLGGIASMFGLLLQIGLVVIVASLLWRWWQRRQQPATAGGPSLRDINGGPASGLGSFGFGGGSAPSPVRELNIEGADFDTFERLLGEIQTAYSNEDLNAIRSRATAEMASYFAEDLDANASRGVVNRISDVKLLQGDLAEAWREDGADYATVAMRFALKDKMVDRSSGRVVEGTDEPQEATELWTFRRVPGGQWLLSAIQQT
ncbi:MAG: Tim44 domain-containing protein [Xanthobacteraceae bacterium]|jgi:predicted lipid-binding transport protein (Tim44 family)